MVERCLRRQATPHLLYKNIGWSDAYGSKLRTTQPQVILKSND
ncbi:MAG: hypothetical protein V7K40_19205 [Nostoc sp.]